MILGPNTDAQGHRHACTGTRMMRVCDAHLRLELGLDLHVEGALGQSAHNQKLLADFVQFFGHRTAVDLERHELNIFAACAAQLSAQRMLEKSGQSTPVCCQPFPQGVE